jgi:hypothetical protein
MCGAGELGHAGPGGGALNKHGEQSSPCAHAKEGSPAAPWPWWPLPLAGWAWPGWLLGRSVMDRADKLGRNWKGKRFFRKIFSMQNNL